MPGQQRLFKYQFWHMSCGMCCWRIRLSSADCYVVQLVKMSTIKLFFKYITVLMFSRFLPKSISDYGSIRYGLPNAWKGQRLLMFPELLPISI